MKKFENLKVGDVLKNDNDYEIVVLDVFTQSCVCEDEHGSAWLHSFKNLEANYYKIVKPEWRADIKGQKYWYIEDDGNKEWAIWENDKIDNFRLKSKNCFETEELAEEYYKKVMES